LLRDKDPHVRAAAVEALGRMGDVRVVDPIAKGLLDDASWDVRKLSVEALGRVRDERAASLLCHALNDRDHDVRQTAAQSLGQLPDKRSIGPLILALKDENSSVRQTAKASLRLLDHLWELSEAAEKAIPALEAAATHREYWVAQSASDALARITDARQKAGESHTNLDPAKEKRDRAIAILCEAARDFDRDLRQAAVEGLGRIGEFGAVAPLVTALNDADEWVGKAAALALNHLNWKPGANEQQQARRMNKLLGVK
jgi:HEAT repeat protein